METNGVLLAICLTIFIVVGVNAALLVALRRGNEASQIDLLKRAAGRARQPWVHEDEALKELSQRVAALKRGEGAGEQGGGDKVHRGGAEERPISAPRRESASLGSGDREHRGESRDHASLPEDSEEL